MNKLANKVIATVLNLKDNFSKTIKETANNTNAFKKEVKETETAADKMKNGVVNTFNTIGESIKRGFGFAIGGDLWETTKNDFVEMVTFGSDLKKSLNGVQSATGYNSEAMAGMKDIMTQIYNDNYGEDFKDIGAAITTIGQQTSESGDKLKALAEDGLALRDTFGFEVNESIRSAKMMMDQFKISGDDAYNLIAQGAQRGLDKNGDLLDSINEYSVQFKQLGFNADDMFNMLNNGAASGTFSVDKLGDSVKEFGIRAKDGSSTTVQAFKDLGLDSDTMTKKFANGGADAKEAFDEVNKKLLTMDDTVKQNQTGVSLWGTMWEDLGKEGISALTDVNGEISTTTDSLQDIKKIKYDDIGSAFEGIKRNIQTGILLPISDAVLPKLSEFSTWFVNNIPSIQTNVASIAKPFFDFGSALGITVLPALKDLGAACLELAATVLSGINPAFASVTPDSWTSISTVLKEILGGATSVVNFIKDNWSTIAPIVTTITAALGTYKLALMAVNAWTVVVAATTAVFDTIKLMIWGITEATTLWEAAEWALTVAMDANPLGLICALIAAVGLAIYETIVHWQDICTWAKATWDALTNNPIADFILATNPLTGVLYNIVKHFDDISSAISKAWDWLKSWNDTPADSKTIDVSGGVDALSVPTLSAPTAANATGTQYWKGGLTTVGEHGPELVNLPSGSKVSTASQTQKMASNGGMNIQVVIQGNVIGNEEYADYVGNHIANKVNLALVNM